VPTSRTPTTAIHTVVYIEWNLGSLGREMKRKKRYRINPDTQKYLGQQQQQQNCLCFYYVVVGVRRNESIIFSQSPLHMKVNGTGIYMLCSCCYPEYWSNKYLIETWIMHGQCRTRRLLFAKRIYISNVFSHQIWRLKKLSN
jgi:hypothetical protein